MFLLMIMYIILGALMDELAMMLLTVGPVFKLIVALGFDPIWFGVMFVTVCEIGMIVPPVGTAVAKVPTSIDLPLVRTLGKAFYWERLIESGEVANATELARLFKLEAGWVSEVLRMTLLAPDIIRAILDGRQPRHLNLHSVRGRQKEVPLDWEEQRRLFGFAGATRPKALGGCPYVHDDQFTAR